MLDPDFVRNNLGAVRAMVVARNMNPQTVLRNFQLVDEQRREAITRLQGLQSERNRITAEIEVRRGIKELVERSKALKVQVPEAEETAKRLTDEFMDIMAGIPNMPHGFLETYNAQANIGRIAPWSKSARRSRGSRMLLHCDRCHRKVDGWVDEDGTSYGVYVVDHGEWAKFADGHETLLCDKCMHCDPRYIAVYGPSCCETDRKFEGDL